MEAGRVGNFAKMRLTATKWQGGYMSKFTRVAEFAAASWVLIGTFIGAFSLRDFFEVLPGSLLASYGVTTSILVVASIWHLRRAIRGR